MSTFPLSHITRHRARYLRWLGFCLLVFGRYTEPRAAGADVSDAPQVGKPQLEIIPQAKWDRIEQSVEKAITWLLRQQRADGAFRTPGPHETAITSLSVMAMLSNGHTPGDGPRGRAINAGIDFVLGCQQPDGQITSSPQHTHSTYHHAIAVVMLGECYGMTTDQRSKRIALAIRKALAWTEQLQFKGNRRRPQDKGGWRYASNPGGFRAWQISPLPPG